MPPISNASILKTAFNEHGGKILKEDRNILKVMKSGYSLKLLYTDWTGTYTVRTSAWSIINRGFYGIKIYIAGGGDQDAFVISVAQYSDDYSVRRV